MKHFFLILLISMLPFPSFAEEKGRETGLATPRFVSLKANEANLRKGPGTRYPIEWVFKRKALPVEVLEEFGHWRRIRTSDGTNGWLHKQMLSGSRHALITDQQHVTLRANPEDNAPPALKLESGVVASIEECEQAWCLIQIGEHEGWLEKSKFYGAYAKELYNR